MIIKREFVLRDIAGDHLLVPVGKTAIDMNGLVVLNGVGARIWELLPEVADEETLVDALAAEYEADRSELTADIKEFLDKLRQMDILE